MVARVLPPFRVVILSRRFKYRAPLLLLEEQEEQHTAGPWVHDYFRRRSRHWGFLALSTNNDLLGYCLYHLHKDRAGKNAIVIDTVTVTKETTVRLAIGRQLILRVMAELSAEYPVLFFVTRCHAEAIHDMCAAAQLHCCGAISSHFGTTNEPAALFEYHLPFCPQYAFCHRLQLSTNESALE